MLFEIKNIGKIRETRIQLRGVTVLAGKNSTGKSTVGKALFCMFNAFCESDKKITKERKKNIERSIFHFSRQFVQPPAVRPSQVSWLADSIWKEMDTPQKIRTIIQGTIGQRVSIPFGTDDPIDMLVKKICAFAAIDDEQIQKEIFGNYLVAEFDEQVTHVNDRLKHGEMTLLFKDLQFYLSVFVDSNECKKYEGNVGIVNQAFYIDTPFVMDMVTPHDFRPYSNKFNHRSMIIECLRAADSNDNLLEHVFNKQKFKSVLAYIDSAVPGKFHRTESGGLGFQEPGLSYPLEMANISAGMKLFLIIRNLLETGAIQERDVLILDEPEIHLHPEWQVEFVRALLVLQKTFNLTILLTTHSPYFLRAIEVLSVEQKIADNCNYYYLANDNEGYSRVQDVTEDTGAIYQILAKPFQTLDNVHYGSYDK